MISVSDKKKKIRKRERLRIKRKKKKTYQQLYVHLKNMNRSSTSNSSFISIHHKKKRQNEIQRIRKVKLYRWKKRILFYENNLFIYTFLFPHYAHCMLKKRKFVSSCCSMLESSLCFFFLSYILRELRT